MVTAGQRRSFILLYSMSNMFFFYVCVCVCVLFYMEDRGDEQERE